MVIDNKYNFGDIVYLKTDKEQLPRMVVRFSVYPERVSYCIASGTLESWHDSFELSYEKDIVLTTSN